MAAGGYTKIVIVAILALVAMGTNMAEAASSYSSMCGLSPADLVSCMPAVRRMSPSDPTKACCSAVKNADLKCLCDYYKNNAKDLPSYIDPNLALDLPTKCDVPQLVACPKN